MDDVSKDRSQGRRKIDEGDSVDATVTDDCLVAAAQSGDREAFEQLVRRHQGPIYGFLRARTLEPADAEDLCQEVFIRCYSASATFESPAKVRPWLFGIARNVLREHIRRVSRRKEVAWTALCLEVDTSDSPPEALYEDVVGLLPSCLDSLGQNAQQAIDMHYRSQLRFAQIGERLRRSEGAIKLLMFRARQAIKQCIDRKTDCSTDD